MYLFRSLVWGALALSPAVVAKETIVVCAHIEPGFTTLAPGGPMDLASSISNSTSIDGTTVAEASTVGYDHAIRELIFTGKHEGWVFGKAQGNLMMDAYSYELRLYPSYRHTLYYPRYATTSVAPLWLLTLPPQHAPVRHRMGADDHQAHARGLRRHVQQRDPHQGTW